MLLDLDKKLNSIKKEIESLVKKLGKITDGIQKEVQTALKKKTKKAPAKKKTATKKKVAAKKAPAKKKVVKKKPAKKTTPETASQKIYKIISNSKKGIDVATLIKKTGFNRNKIYNAVKALKKQGKVKSIATGVYKKA